MTIEALEKRWLTVPFAPQLADIEAAAAAAAAAEAAEAEAAANKPSTPGAAATRKPAAKAKSKASLLPTLALGPADMESLRNDQVLPFAPFSFSFHPCLL